MTEPRYPAANHYGRTIWSIMQEGGVHALRSGMFVWSEAAFRKQFRVGDIIQGYGGRVTGKITAIGETRFLFKVTLAGNMRERVGTMRQIQGWAPVPRDGVVKKARTP